MVNTSNTKISFFAELLSYPRWDGWDQRSCANRGNPRTGTAGRATNVEGIGPIICYRDSYENGQTVSKVSDLVITLSRNDIAASNLEHHLYGLLLRIND